MNIIDVNIVIREREGGGEGGVRLRHVFPFTGTVNTVCFPTLGGAICFRLVRTGARNAASAPGRKTSSYTTAAKSSCQGPTYDIGELWYIRTSLSEPQLSEHQITRTLFFCRKNHQSRQTTLLNFFDAKSFKSVRDIYRGWSVRLLSQLIRPLTIQYWCILQTDSSTPGLSVCGDVQSTPSTIL